MFASMQKRKNKQFADGVLVVKADSSCTLYNEVCSVAILHQSSELKMVAMKILNYELFGFQEGKVTAKSKAKGCWDLADGADVTVGNWEIEVDRALDEATFR